MLYDDAILRVARQQGATDYRPLRPVVYDDAILRVARATGATSYRPATRTATAAPSGGGIGGFLSNLGGVFRTVTTAANNLTARATGTGTDNAPDDGARDWLSRLPQISNAVMDMIGANTPQETVVTQAGFGPERGGLDLQTIAIIGAVGFGIYYIATSK